MKKKTYSGAKREAQHTSRYWAGPLIPESAFASSGTIMGLRSCTGYKNLLLRAIAKCGTYESLLACPLIAHPRKSYRKPGGKKKLKLQFMCEELRLEICT